MTGVIPCPGAPGRSCGQEDIAMSQACDGQCQCRSSAPSSPITATSTVEEVVRRFPGANQVLERLGINHSCGARLPLDLAAASAGLPLETLLARLREATGVSA